VTVNHVVSLIASDVYHQTKSGEDVT